MSFASAVAFALLHSLWQVALLALLAWVSLALMRGASARARHAVGMGWLVAMAIAPVLTFALCWQSPTLAASGAQGEPLLKLDDSDVGPLALMADARSGWLMLGAGQLWLLGVLLMIVRQFGGWRAMRLIEGESFVHLPPEWQYRVEAMRVALGISRDVAVRLAEQVASPFTAHVLRPLIWLPLTLLTQLPRDQIEALLAHELAHIQRLDWCWNALQCGIESVLFHHPGMWWLSRRIREEREHACDDLAVTVCGDAIVLAEALAALQRQRRMHVAPMLALAAEGGSLMNRVAHLLSVTPARPSLRWPVVLVLLLGTSSLLAMQFVPPQSLLVNLRSDASSLGPLTPGNYREYKASYLGDKQRSYRISMDAAGHVEEIYAEDGQRKTMDEGARRWLKSVTLMANGETPAPPKPPAPPALPRLPSESEAFRTLMTGLQADHELIALTGQPVTMDRTSFHGRIHTWGARDFHLWGIDDPVGGKASFTVTFVGPQGRVNVAWSGKTVAGVWKAESKKFSSLPA